MFFSSDFKAKRKSSGGYLPDGTVCSLSGNLSAPVLLTVVVVAFPRGMALGSVTPLGLVPERQLVVVHG